MQVLDLLKGSLRSIGAYAAGEAPDADDFNDALYMCNLWLEQQSNSTMMVPYVTEVIWTLTGNQQNYTIGPGGTIGGAFTGTTTLTTLTVSAIPAGNITLGQYVTGAGVSPGTQIVQFLTGSGGVGTYQVNTSQSVGSIAMKSYYQRPLRINSGFVRVATLDYLVFPLNIAQYQLIGLKTLNGPWPKYIYYQPSSPVGNITCWPNPSSGEMHLFAETVLSQFQSLAQVITLPEGYGMAVHWCIAELLMPEFGKTTDPVLVQMVNKNASDAKAWIKRTNMQPPMTASFPDALLQSQNRVANSAFIFSGGFVP
jgi:hypothetical protein